MNTTTNRPASDEAITINIPGVVEAQYIPGDPIITSCISLNIIDEGAFHLRHVYALIKMLEGAYPEAEDNIWFELRRRPVYDRLADEDKEWGRSRLPVSDLLRWRSKSELDAIAAARKEEAR